MAFMNPVADLVAWLGWYVIPFIVILSAIVFVHGLLGHYLVGRWSGVKIDAFSLGFGPDSSPVWICAAPDGGWERFRSAATSNSTATPMSPASKAPLRPARLSIAPSRWPGQPLPNRAAIVLAGPVANFILAFVIFTGMFMAFGRVEHAAGSGGLKRTARRQRAGFKAGDLVKSINGDAINSFELLQEATLMSTGLPMRFVVERQGNDIDLTATPKVTVVDQGVFGKRRMGHLGLASAADPKDVKIKRCSLPTCAVWGDAEEWFIVKATGTYIMGIFAGRELTDQVSGLIGAAQMAGEMAKISLWEVVQPRRVVLGIRGLHEPAPDPASGRGASRLLRLRGVAGVP